MNDHLGGTRLLLLEFWHEHMYLAGIWAPYLALTVIRGGPEREIIAWSTVMILRSCFA